MDTRTKDILEAIIDEFVDTAEPVGSLNLQEARRFSFSPATLRAEMALLEDLGFLTHPHTSAGRIPTQKGYRFYVDNFLDEFPVNFREIEAIRKTILSFSNSFEKLLSNTAQTLASLTGNAGFIYFNGIVYSKGLSNLLRLKEFSSQKYAVGVSEIIDNLEEIVKVVPENKKLEIFIGAESPVAKDANCSILVSRFFTKTDQQGFVGIIGPTRMNYEKNLGILNIIKRLLET